MILESKNKVDTSTEVRARIERSIHTPAAQRLWAQLKKRPSVGVVLTGVAGVALASLVGVGELTIGIIAGYAAYQVLREGVAPGTVAHRVVEELEKLA